MQNSVLTSEQRKVGYWDQITISRLELELEPDCDNPQNKLKTGYRRHAGLLFSLLAGSTERTGESKVVFELTDLIGLGSGICSTFGGLATKTLTRQGYKPVDITLWRFQGMTICIPLVILYLRIVKKENIFATLWQDERKITTIVALVIRATVGFMSFVFYAYALKYLDLADATVIAWSTPIAVTLFARIFLGEPCGIVPVIAALVTFSGVIILTKPPLLTGQKEFNDQTLFGASLAFAAMLTIALLFVVLRYLRTVHITLTLLFLSYIVSIECLIANLIFGLFVLPATPFDCLVAFGAAVVEVFVQVFQTLALKYEEAGPVALIRTSDIVIAFVVQLIFLGVYPDVLSIVGATIITLGVIFISLRRLLANLPEKHPARVKYWFILK